MISDQLWFSIMITNTVLMPPVACCGSSVGDASGSIVANARAGVAVRVFDGAIMLAVGVANGLGAGVAVGGAVAVGEAATGATVGWRSDTAGAPDPVERLRKSSTATTSRAATTASTSRVGSKRLPVGRAPVLGG